MVGLILGGQAAHATRPLKQGRVRVDGLTGILEGSTGRAKSRQWLLNVGTGVSAALWGQVPLLLEDANGISCLRSLGT